ncbi:hypothetical protein OBBRIDRAFT_655781 [Obba rivulosa]|uniref:Uncharacterized protein n=1 Tax=Obba rivulosa TaxID=1052685 RepID=A0A8E2DND7_9APHY|nr:hypothetical protein OBBRIDRAFT_655781 [Obba rivulosa]
MSLVYPLSLSPALAKSYNVRFMYSTFIGHLLAARLNQVLYSVKSQLVRALLSKLCVKLRFGTCVKGRRRRLSFCPRASPEPHCRSMLGGGKLPPPALLLACVLPTAKWDTIIIYISDRTGVCTCQRRRCSCRADYSHVASPTRRWRMPQCIPRQQKYVTVIFRILLYRDIVPSSSRARKISRAK